MRLLRLTVDDFGLIAHAAVEFADGLTVLSGETGSGKTMLLGALRFVLGERTETDLIRGGAARARVILEIEPDAALRHRVTEVGFPLADDDDVILTRELLATGRSHGRVNGVAASASQLRAIAASIVDVVGQHDAQQLLAPTFALETVDRCGGSELERAAADVRSRHRAWQALESELAELRRDDGQLVAELEFARFAASEIDAANLAEAEEERLRERREVLANAEKIGTTLAVAAAALEDERGAIDAAGSAARALAGIARFGDRFAELATAVAGLQSEISEIATRLARERDAVEAEPAELEAILARLEQIDRVKRKYGGTIAVVRAARSAFAARIERDAGREGRIAELVTESTRLRRELDARAGVLSELRRAAAGQVEARVAAELRALAMPNGRFSVAFEPLERPGPAGAERAEFRLAANAGEPQRPIAKSASGGELSRVLLAIVVAIADQRQRSALVFDEIDAGIGGATAAVVGARLGLLARAGQVVVVTHLAQIASWADAHLALRKHDVRGATVIELETLTTREARLGEIARMLSGEANSVSLEHAATLVAGVRSR